MATSFQFYARTSLFGKFFALACFACAHLSCSSVFFCDDYGEDGCQNEQPEQRTYHFSVPPDKLSSWENLSYFMYFHARITPGLRVNESLSEEKQKLYRNGAACEYILTAGKAEVRSVRGHMEGFRVDPEGFWCFDYLGAMLLEWHRQNKSQLEEPSVDFSPFDLTIRYLTPDEMLTGQKKASIRLEWEKAL